MCIERLLAGPRFHDGEMSGPADLLEQFDADVAFILAARVAVLFERNHCCRSGRRCHLEITDRVTGSVYRRFGTALRPKDRRKKQDGTEQKVKRPLHVRPPPFRIQASTIPLDRGSAK